jgi:hypothetical protein
MAWMESHLEQIACPLCLCGNHRDKTLRFCAYCGESNEHYDAAIAAEIRGSEKDSDCQNGHEQMKLAAVEAEDDGRLEYCHYCGSPLWSKDIAQAS